jgi:hypothetical protein
LIKTLSPLKRDIAYRAAIAGFVTFLAICLVMIVYNSAIENYSSLLILVGEGLGLFLGLIIGMVHGFKLGQASANTSNHEQTKS